jgi:hypothetical protein
MLTEEFLTVDPSELIEIQFGLIYLFPPLMMASDKSVSFSAQLLQWRAT